MSKSLIVACDGEAASGKALVLNYYQKSINYCY